MVNDPTYVKAEIDSNPIWKRAFQLSELENDNAPIGWGNYIKRAYEEMKSEAATVVRRHAEEHCQSVLTFEVEGVCGALGEISIAEAKDTLDRIQAERMGLRKW